MKANILRDALGNITVQMEGDLDYEFSMPFRDEVTKLADDNPHSKITIDLGGVDFVGSSGICHFVDTVKLLNNKKKIPNQVSITNMTAEFQQVFKLYTLDEALMDWDEFDMDSDSTSQMSSQFANRKRTFEN